MNTAERLSYGDYMKTGLKIDRLQQESRNIESILNSLNENGAHKITGIMYDYFTLRANKDKIEQEIKYLDSIMDANK